MSKQTDTSRIVKNPLLAMSGFTIDDFSHNALLLPAAAMPVLPEPSPLLEEDKQKSVIFGSEPVANLDSENFSEISLDQSDTDSNFPTVSNNASLSSLPQPTSSSLTEHLSQLPSVASSVLSSFSNILYPTNNSPPPPQPSPLPSTLQNTTIASEINSHSDLSIGNSSANDLYSLDSIAHSQQSMLPPMNDEPIQTPTFYSPNDAPSFFTPTSSLGSLPPTQSMSGNAYRLSAKKKLYAPAPGLNSMAQPPSSAGATHQSNVLPHTTHSNAGNMPPIIPPIAQQQMQSAQVHHMHEPPSAPIEPKQDNGKFSFSSIFSTPKLFQPMVTGQQKADESPEFLSIANSDPKPNSVVQQYSTTPAINPNLFNTKPVEVNSSFSQSTQGISSPQIFVPQQIPATISTIFPAPNIPAANLENPSPQATPPALGTLPSQYGQQPGTTSAVNAMPPPAIPNMTPFNVSQNVSQQPTVDSSPMQQMPLDTNQNISNVGPVPLYNLPQASPQPTPPPLGTLPNQYGQTTRFKPIEQPGTTLAVGVMPPPAVPNMTPTNVSQNVMQQPASVDSSSMQQMPLGTNQSISNVGAVPFYNLPQASTPSNVGPFQTPTVPFALNPNTMNTPQAQTVSFTTPTTTPPPINFFMPAAQQSMGNVPQYNQTYQQQGSVPFFMPQQVPSQFLPPSIPTPSPQPLPTPPSVLYSTNVLPNSTNQQGTFNQFSQPMMPPTIQYASPISNNQWSPPFQPVIPQQQPSPQPTPPLPTNTIMQSQTDSFSQSRPPTVNASQAGNAPPPVGLSSSSSYRLRGRPHYKCPVSAYETVPASKIIDSQQVSPFPPSSVNIFSPFAVVEQTPDASQPKPFENAPPSFYNPLQTTTAIQPSVAPIQQFPSESLLMQPRDEKQLQTAPTQLLQSKPYATPLLSSGSNVTAMPPFSLNNESAPVQMFAPPPAPVGNYFIPPVQDSNTPPPTMVSSDELASVPLFAAPLPEPTNILSAVSQGSDECPILQETTLTESHADFLQPSGVDVALFATPPVSNYSNAVTEGIDHNLDSTTVTENLSLQENNSTTVDSLLDEVAAAAQQLSSQIDENDPKLMSTRNVLSEMELSNTTDLSVPVSDFTHNQDAETSSAIQRLEKLSLKSDNLDTNVSEVDIQQSDSIVSPLENINTAIVDEINQGAETPISVQQPSILNYFSDQSSNIVATSNSNVVNFFSATTPTTSNNSIDWFSTTTPQSNTVIKSSTENSINHSPINFFNASSTTASILAPSILPQPQQQSNNIATYSEIQNFFNNPPPLSDIQQREQSYIANNSINNRLQNIAVSTSLLAPSLSGDYGSFSSNLVEPPSSAQSEFSEILDTTTSTHKSDLVEQNQEQLDAANNTLISTIESSENNNFDKMASALPLTTASTTTVSNDQPNGTQANVAYRPVYKHWFYRKSTSTDTKQIWTPFSMADSLQLEEALDDHIITTDGGRYDVNKKTRKRTPVYWNGIEEDVRRCSWFYKGTDSRLVPYDESTADNLEAEYRDAANTGEWHRKLPLPNGETVAFHGPSVIVHFLQSEAPDSWPNSSVPQTANRPRVVKRGIDEFNIEDGESEQIDHLMFMVHGIGAACDLKFRPVEEVVEEFRSIALQLTQSHYRSSCDKGEVGRIEILPISWHSELHSEESGIDEKLKSITLESIPKLRTFTNDTLLDILFYTSPHFCQRIVDAVAGSINCLYAKFCQRNPSFHGNVSLAGHSLGSLILFDLLQHQRSDPKSPAQEDDDVPEITELPKMEKRPLRRKISQQNYAIGRAGTGQPYIRYPQLHFKPKKFFALGSPIGMFVTIRGIDNLGLDFKLPTTDGFYNIFHPYDPVAYRIEALVNTDLSNLRPVLIAHHKGRKRMHLELRETMARVGNDIKQRIVDTYKTTMNTVYNLATLQKPDTANIQTEVDKVIRQQLRFERQTSTSSTSSEMDNGETDIPLGILNEGKRIDYVLQEAPLEFFNEYLFALTSHVCYWESEDTTLFIIKEIYSSQGIRTDNQIPQPTMTIERSISRNDSPLPF